MWLSRSLFQGPRVAMVTSQAQFSRALRAIRMEGDAGPFCNPSWRACTHAYDVDGELVCIVGVNLRSLQGADPIGVASLLVHEAVHVWQRTRAALGPGDLGVEMEAYAVENIAAELMRAYVNASSAAAAAHGA